MQFSSCPEYKLLQSELMTKLETLMWLATAELDALRNEHYETFMSLESQFELVFSAKQNALAVFRKHLTEHRCQPGAIAAA
jgi:hypothetical protein